MRRVAIALLVLGAGCRFSIDSVKVGVTADDLSVTAVDQLPPPAGDLAVSAPFDLARSLTITPDMRHATPPDMSHVHPPDMAGCTRIDESFGSDPSGRWTLAGSASYDANNKRLQLTDANGNAAGSAFFNTAITTSAFDARFDFRSGDGTGADGMAMVLAQSATIGGLMPFGNGTPNQGYGLGYLGMDGFAVELDTFQNVGNGDPDGNHVGFMHTGDGRHLLTGTPPMPPLHSASTRSAHVRFTGTHVKVEIDGTSVIDGDLPANSAWAPGTFFFGFTGATGGMTDRHTISSFTLISGTPGDCF